jgi:hypothetical protein
MLKTSSARSCLFLLVRSHSQMQCYLNLQITQRAANESGFRQLGAREPGKVLEIQPLRSSLQRSLRE